MLAEIEVRDTKPAGDCAAEGGSEGRKEAGEEGGAAKGTTMGGGWPKLRAGGGASAAEDVASEIRMACPMRLLYFCDPKQQDILQKPPHLLFCMLDRTKTKIKQLQFNKDPSIHIESQ